MAKIKLVIDSTADIPQEILKDMDITVLPLSVLFGQEEFKDGIDITPDEFYEKLEKFDGFPTTSQVTPVAFKEAFSELIGEADTILSMHLSEKMSGTFNAARIAAQEFSGVEIITYDSESATLGFGYQVLEAYRAIQEGCSITEVLRRVDEVKKNLRLYFSVPNLDHLHKGGRIGKATVLLGGLLNIIPILTVEDGVVAPFEKIRGKKRVVKRLLELVGQGVEDFGGAENINLTVLHTVNLDLAKQLAQDIKDQYGFNDVMITQVGTIIGTHIGPGVIATIFHKKV